MLPNNSQELPSQGNDNQFLPNNSHSYESMIKEHQERRSLILNDQLLMPSGFSNGGKEHQEENNFGQSLRGMLGGQSGIQGSGFGKEQIEQNEENQFLVNQQSLAASIQQAINSNQSKLQSSNSQIQHFLEQPHSNNDPIFPSYNNQKQQSNFQPQAKQQQQENDEDVPHFGNYSGDLGIMNSNIQSKKQNQSQQPQVEISRNNQDSDPFQNVASRHQTQNQQNQQFPLQSTVKNNQRGFNNFQQSEEPQIQSLPKEQSQNFLGNHSFSQQPKQQSKQQQQMYKSRSQIQGIYSGLDAQSGIKQPQQQPCNSINSQDIPSHNTQSQALKSQQVLSHQQHPQSDHSLSNLMKYNYFQKAYHQYSQKVQSQELPSSHKMQQSEVKVFKQQHNSLLGNLSQSKQRQSQSALKNNKIELNNASAEQIDHILMNYQSNKSINERNNIEPKQQLIINNFNNFSQSVNKSHEEILQMDPQPSSHTNYNHFSEQSKNQIINLEQIDRIKRQHDEQVQQFEINHSQLRSSKKQSSSKRISQHSQHYFNEFNDQEQPIDHNDQDQIGSKQSKIKHEKQQNMHSIKYRQNHSKIEDYDLHSSKSHKKQKCLVQKSTKNNSVLHLPEIDVKNKRASQISRRSNISKKTPSIKIENDSKLSIPNSKPEILKKNSSKIQKNTRDKMVSYSQGMQFDNQNSQIYRQVMLGSTTLDSKSITMKKKEESTKQIFNTVPQGINIINSEPFVQIQHKQKPKQIIIKNKHSSNVENIAHNTKEIVLKSPIKQRQQQIQRIRVLKQAQRKRIQRELEKVKKQLQEINTRQKDMDRIFEEKQKMEAKEREKIIINSRQNDFSYKITRHHRENEALLNIIKEHRKSKETNEQNNDNFQQNIAKNLLQLNQIRKQAEQKIKEKKRLEILDRMKKNQMRKINEQKLIEANNQYIQQFRSVDNPVLSPQPHVQNQSKEKGLVSNKKIQKQAGVGSRASKFILHNQRKMAPSVYEQKLD